MGEGKSDCKKTLSLPKVGFKAAGTLDRMRTLRRDRLDSIVEHLSNSASDTFPENYLS